MTMTSSTATGAFWEALAEFATTFGHEDVAGELAGRMNCVELDALAGLLRAFGRDDAADLWIAAHARGDDEGDSHHTGEGVA